MPAEVHPDPRTLLIGGGSVVVSPLGEVLAGPLHGGEGVLHAELDLRELARARGTDTASPARPSRPPALAPLRPDPAVTGRRRWSRSRSSPSTR
jgi:hypothetical protein